MKSAAVSRMGKMMRDRRLASGVVLAAIAMLSALGAFLLVENFAVLKSLDHFVQDWEISRLARTMPTDPEITIVAIKEETLKRFPYRSPLDRAFLSDLLVKIAAAKPKVIGLDFLLDDPTEPAKDEKLRKTIASLDVPLVVAYSEEHANVTPDQLAYLRAFVPPSRRALPNLAKDQQGTVRWVYPGAEDAQGRYILGFERAIAAHAGIKTPKAQVPVVWTRAPANESSYFPELNAEIAGIFPPQTFTGKIVLIGSDLSLVDRHRTPFVAASDEGILPGIVVHAYGVSTLLHPDWSPYTGWKTTLAIALLLSTIGAILGLLNFHLLPRIAALVVLLAGFWVAAVFLYWSANTIIDLLAPSLAMIVSFSAMDSLTGRDARKQRQFIQGAFSRYVSPKVVEALIADPARMSLEGERREMTYLFTDVANFTTMSEKVDSKELAQLLNAYFEGVTAVVLRHSGMVDKFIGDAVFAIFNAPVDLPNHAGLAVRCALEIDDFCEAFRKKQNAAGIDLGITRVGVHTGTAVIGNFGSASRFNYTAQGDAVNTAARLEGLNKQLGTRVCVSGDTKNLCWDMQFRPIASVVLKGKGKAVEVWEPLREGALTAGWLDRYGSAFAQLREAPEEALALLGELDHESPGDPCVRFHMRRLREGLKGADLVMTEK
ncbi:MAG TPA: adenylate/guanylate cyclase domain-containing protein [Rhizomicrobium sp.]|jgi:class 3 adenylate cyclase